MDDNPDPARQIFDDYLDFVQDVRATIPEVIIYFVVITPTGARWMHWPIATKANRLIQEQTQNDPNLRYIDFTEQLLGTNGKSDRNLYKFDQLHPNLKGYAIWSAAIKPRLETELPVSS